MMKIRKYISILMIVIMTFILGGCGVTTPRSVVEEYFESLVAGKEDEINNMVTDALNKSIFGDTSTTSEEVQGGMTEETKEILNEIVSKMKYKVNSEKVESNSAKVNVTVTGGNISKAFMGYLGDLMTLAYTSTVLNSTPKEEYNILVNSILWEKFNTIEYDERTFDINLKKDGDKWNIETDATFYELLLGSSAKQETDSGK